MTEAGYGTWTSPITSTLTSQSGVRLNQLRTDTDPNFSDKVYWNEIRPDEGGRYVICSSDAEGNHVEQWTPREFNARTTVHEYGGGDFIVHQGVVYFSNFSDQLLYRQASPSATPEALTDAEHKSRFADGCYSTQKSRIYYVREQHGVSGRTEAQNTVVSVDPATRAQAVLVQGADFYSCPRVSPDGGRITWVQWYHPNMPWDSTEVWVADLSADGDSIVEGSAVKVSGGKDAKGNDVSVSLPSWSSHNELMYIGDQTDWWNLYTVNAGGHHVNLHPTDCEIGGPEWQLGRNVYVVEPNDGRRVATTFKSELAILDPTTNTYTPLDTGFTTHGHLAWTGAGSLYLIAASPTKFAQVIRVDVNTSKVNVIRVSQSPPVSPLYFSVPERITWPTAGGEICHGLLYQPKNKDFVGKKDELPPVLMRAHGGPTSAYSSSLDLKIQYFTSRGFAVLCVDYRGSTGYGKQYRHRLRGQWGVCDIEDCRTGVEYLVRERLCDPHRTCIDGGSAGGYTTLACLTFTKTFKAGVSHYGVSDLAALMAETHKFESRYLDTLLAPDGGKPDDKVVKERSPIHYVDNISCAVGFFQGDEDKIVPPNQAEMMYTAVKAKGLPAMYVLFKGEQHGFRKAENIQTALDGEFYFFGKVLGFEPADKGIELPIDNL